MRKLCLLFVLMATVAFAGEDKREELLKQYQSEITKNPLAIESHRNYQNLMREMGKMDEVKKEYQAKLDNESNSPLNHYLYGRLLEGATLEKEYKRALELDEKYPDKNRDESGFRLAVYYGLAYFYKDAKKWDEAIKYFDDYLHNVPMEVIEQNLDVIHYFALCLHQKGETERALKEWDNLLEMQPDYLDARLGKATALKAQGKFDQAIAELEVIIKKDEVYWNAYEPLVQCYHAKQDYKNGEEIMRQFQIRYDKKHLADMAESAYIVIDILKFEAKVLIVKQHLWTSPASSQIPPEYYFEFYAEGQIDKKPSAVYTVNVGLVAKSVYQVKIIKNGNESKKEIFRDKSAPTYQELLNLILAKEKGK